MTSRWVGVAMAVALSAAAPGAKASPPPDPAQAFVEAATALERGAFDDAIDRFEALADSGFVHPDASFDRAAAYLARAVSPQARPGDLGQVVAGLSEVLQLRPGDREAAQALVRVREEIANRRLRAGLEPAVVTVALGRAVVGLLDEVVWLVLAGLGSLVLALGLAVRAVFRPGPVRLGAGVAASVGAGLFAVATAFAVSAGQYRRSSTPAVVVAAQARLLTADGRPLQPQAAKERHVAAPEGATVFVTARQGRWLAIEWGTTRAFVAPSDVRVLARR
ncbi:MAG: hypothetical protein JW751_11860 [Polyangiaceae bacterium]|nr:hypothetical protein [Polyangiaceae bacterium]